MTSPENILLCSADDDNPVIKVVDLGLPELVNIHAHPKTSCYVGSLGVILCLAKFMDVHTHLKTSCSMLWA